MSQNSSRRHFLAALGGGATALWFADHLGALEAAASHAEHMEGQTGQRSFEFFTLADARIAEAIGARIFPNDDGTAGAREAGAVYFMDHVAARFLPERRRTIIRDGLATLQKDVAANHPGARDFAALTNDQQDTLLRARETTPFFELMRALTLGGVLSSPKLGGNRKFVGWKLVGHDPSPTYQPPFGYYDRPDVGRQMLGDDA